MSSHRERSRSHPRSAARRFVFERLEHRTLLAVATSLVNGDLTITGDAANDDIAIVGTANPGEVTITGRNGTLVNGVANGSTTVPGVTSDLVVSLNDSDDRVTLDNTFIAGDIVITTGDGADTVITGETSPVSPAGNLTIDTGAGDDVVQEDTTIYNTFVVRENRITTGDGNDRVSLYGASALGQIVIVGGTGNDSILLNGVTGDSSITLNGEAGGNSMAVLLSSATSSINLSATYSTNPFTEPPWNTFYVDTVFCASIQIGTANGLTNDPGGTRQTSVTVAASVARSLGVATGDGINHIVLRGNTSEGSIGSPGAGQAPVGSQLSIGDRGTNDILIQYNAFSIVLGFSAGEHNVAVIGNIGENAYLNGAAGPSYLLFSGNRFRNQTITNFIQ